jgi:hypothetical protein
MWKKGEEHNPFFLSFLMAVFVKIVVKILKPILT